jgi:hypothetical protein
MTMGLHDDPMPAAGDPSDTWEWVGPDGLTDSRRAELVAAWREGYGDVLTEHEAFLVRHHLGIE